MLQFKLAKREGEIKVSLLLALDIWLQLNHLSNAKLTQNIIISIINCSIETVILKIEFNN